ncbi:MAG: glycosyltransferase family 87 protein [Chloroflexota bacterium]
MTPGKITRTQYVMFGLLAVASLLLLSWLSKQLHLTSWDFRNNLWSPATLLVSGKSPYAIQTISPDGNAVWFPVAIGAFLPLGWLSLSYASVIWLFLNIGLIIVLVVMAANGEKPRIFPFAMGLLIIFLHPRVIAHLQLGQYTVFATTMFLLAAYAVSNKKILLAAFLVAIALAKPQLGFLVVPGIAVACFKLYGLRKAIQYLVYLSLITLLFSLPLFVGYRNWIPDFVTALQHNPGWAQPSFLSVLQNFAGVSAVLVWLLFALMFFSANIWLWYRLPPLDVIYWSMALTPLITPYVWSWDFVMMLPLFVRVLYELRRRWSYLVLLGGYVIMWWLMLQVVLQTAGDDQFFVWVSWMTILVIFAALALEKKLGENPKPIFRTLKTK